MTVYSMTAYTSARFEGQNTNKSNADSTSTSPLAGQFSVDIRSINSRFLDLSLRLPDEYRHLEAALRECVSKRIKRGKLELRLDTRSAQPTNTALPPCPSDAWLNQLSTLQTQIQAHSPNAQPLSVLEILHWAKSHETGTWSDEDIVKCTQRAVEGLLEARAREGEKLAAMLQERIAALRDLVQQVRPLLPQVVQRQQDRFLQRWNDALQQAQFSQDNPTNIDPHAAQERALNEAASLALRIDVAEELDRLQAHLDEISHQLQRGGEVGKRLDFLIQELHREANTLGSKSAALETTAISVSMKVLIEQMREQIQNLE